MAFNCWKPVPHTVQGWIFSRSPVSNHNDLYVYWSSFSILVLTCKCLTLFLGPSYCLLYFQRTSSCWLLFCADLILHWFFFWLEFMVDFLLLSLFILFGGSVSLQFQLVLALSRPELQCKDQGLATLCMFNVMFTGYVISFTKETTLSLSAFICSSRHLLVSLWFLF